MTVVVNLKPSEAAAIAAFFDELLEDDVCDHMWTLNASAAAAIEKLQRAGERATAGRPFPTSSSTKPVTVKR